MRKTTIILALFIVFGISFKAFSQEHNHHHHNHINKTGVPYCVIDELVAKHVKQNPKVLDQYLVYEENMRQLISAMKANENYLKNNPYDKTDTLLNGKRIVPVVFHIIHKGGDENISDEQVHDAIEKLNLDYSRRNADTSETYSLFKDRAVSFDIEFRLAKIDPDGNCTNGIDRVFDPATDYGYFNIMGENAWPYSKYMNVYAVSFIQPEGINLPPGAMIGGLSPFTPDNALSPTAGDTTLDGVLVRHDCVGTIGTASDFAGTGSNNQNRTMTHECGHFFNLYHPFQDMIAQLAGGDGCGMLFSNGDEVSDTPPCQTSGMGCPTPGSVNTCDTDNPDEPDMTGNYMDYYSGPCQNAFTAGQKERVDATLADTRRRLWSKENLIATGVLDTTPSNCAPKADFHFNSNMICAGNTVTYTDLSYNGSVDNWNWEFEGGTPNTSTEQHPEVTYDNAGTYKVKLTVSNSQGEDSIIKNDVIYVYNQDNAEEAPYIESFESSTLEDKGWIQFSNDGNAWEINNSVGATGGKCLYIKNYEDNLVGSSDEIITPAFDLTTIDMMPLKLKFKIAYAGITQESQLTGTTDSIYDQLKIYVSTNCGKSWTLRYTKTGNSLATVNTISDAEFVPSSASDWRQDFINLNSYTTNQHVKLKFVFKSNGGNNLYIDDIELFDNTSIEDIENAHKISISPNPINNKSLISFKTFEKQHVSVKIYDVLGKEISTLVDNDLNKGNHEYEINAENFESAGIYLVKITIGEYTFTKKAIIE